MGPALSMTAYHSMPGVLHLEAICPSDTRMRHSFEVACRMTSSGWNPTHAMLETLPCRSTGHRANSEPHVLFDVRETWTHMGRSLPDAAEA